MHLTWTKGISYPRASVHAGHALEYFRQGDLPSTMESIDRAIGLAPDVPVYHMWKGLVFSTYRHDLTSTRELRCATQRDLPYQTCLATLAHQSNLNDLSQRPFYLHSRISSANSAFNLDMYDESIRYRQESSDMVPGSWGLRNNLASALIHIGYTSDALEALQKSLEITDGTDMSLDALKLEARTNMLLRRYWEASDDLDRALAINPGDARQHVQKWPWHTPTLERTP